ncbi:uncharacterized protein N7515_009048 [Penicillium bovifimosum]|uniref:Uncharacterized protein n=1 Tax=Penicillium bovifimosum TaxID=126998 RepID=A0A9W9KV50_9EURO|nr:uncharacterized protein N7515_009048 [Penicillium bovifimosum]KAJ5121087.1 hypothetical protein N7515_009048 [Penicillium bovifimosum]
MMSLIQNQKSRGHTFDLSSPVTPTSGGRSRRHGQNAPPNLSEEEYISDDSDDNGDDVGDENGAGDEYGADNSAFAPLPLLKLDPYTVGPPIRICMMHIFGG